MRSSVHAVYTVAYILAFLWDSCLFLSLSHFLTIYVLTIIVPDRPSSEGIGQDVLIYVLPIQAKQEQVGVWVCTSPMLLVQGMPVLVFSKMIFLMMPLQLLICLEK